MEKYNVKTWKFNMKMVLFHYYLIMEMYALLYQK